MSTKKSKSKLMKNKTKSQIYKEIEQSKIEKEKIEKEQSKSIYDKDFNAKFVYYIDMIMTAIFGYHYVKYNTKFEQWATKSQRKKQPYRKNAKK